MGWIAFKYLLTAAVVVLVSEAAKRSDRLGAMVAALPLVTFLTLIWLHAEKQPETKIANHAWYTFWYVLPTLPMFLLFPWLLHRFGFWLALLACIGFTALCFAGLATALRGFGLDLWP
jgi:F0F1-type ATP synthase assembly protein I